MRRIEKGEMKKIRNKEKKEGSRVRNVLESGSPSHDRERWKIYVYEEVREDD